jgi:hypothetical protein
VKIPKSIQDISRRKLRYVLFQAQRIANEGGKKLSAEALDLTDAQVAAIEKHFLSKEYTAKTFGSLWDIGIDDLDTMVNRPEKYWLFGISRFQVVERPKETILLLEGDKLVEHQRTWIDSSREGLKFFKREGYTQSVESQPDTVLLDYGKILENVSSRKTWLEGS